MSVNGVSALERGYRRTPQYETLALLADALGLSDEQRQIFQTAARSARQDRAPVSIGPWLSTDTAALPLAMSTFVGRARELGEIATLLRQHRLVTITGAGGVGKTQTALQAVAALGSEIGAPCFAGFAPVGDPSSVATVIASALHVQEVLNRPILGTLVTYLKNKLLLLIFDNCEHVVTQAASIATALLRECPDVRILATSREPLRIAGERVCRLPSLDLPAAIDLFADRATAADSRFVLTAENREAVGAVCLRLDSIPLAIELAAARVNLLRAYDLTKKLDEGLQILTGGERGALPRQQTMRATIEWSYKLLSPAEQRIFERLSIFAGGCALDSATAVCLSEDIAGTDVFDVISSLVDKSLVVTEFEGREPRYRLLEPFRDFGREKLALRDEQDRVSQRHARACLTSAEAADARYGEGSTIAWLAAASLEVPNYRLALEWALTRDRDAILGGAIAGALGRVWLDSGLIAEGRDWIERALERLNEVDQPGVVARLQYALSLLSDGKQRYDLAEHAAHLFESLGDLRGAARAQRLCGGALSQLGRLDEAREVTTQALAASRACGDMWSAAYCLIYLAGIETHRGDLQAARELHRQALAGMRAFGDERGTSIALGSMAESEFSNGHAKEALRLANEAQALASFGKLQTTSWHANVAAYRVALGDVREAREPAREALRLARQLQDDVSVAIALQHLALLAALRGNARCAAQLLGYVNQQLIQFQMKRELTEQWSYDTLLATLREAFREDDLELLAAEGATWSEDQAVQEALNV